MRISSVFVLHTILPLFGASKAIERLVELQTVVNLNVNSLLLHL